MLEKGRDMSASVLQRYFFKGTVCLVGESEATDGWPEVESISMAEDTSLEIEDASEMSRDTLLRPRRVAGEAAFFVGGLAPSPLTLPVLFTCFFSAISILSINSMYCCNFLSSRDNFFSPPGLRFIDVAEVDRDTIRGGDEIEAEDAAAKLALSPPLPPTVFLSRPKDLGEMDSGGATTGHAPRTGGAISSARHSSG